MIQASRDSFRVAPASRADPREVDHERRAGARLCGEDRQGATVRVHDLPGAHQARAEIGPAEPKGDRASRHGDRGDPGMDVA
jgi:hypothetical protein